MVETPNISLPGLISVNIGRLQELKLEIKADYEKFVELDLQYKALNERKAEASILLGLKLIDARDHQLPKGEFAAFLKELHRDIGISRRMAYYHIANARSGLDCATVAQMGFRGVEKHLRLKDATLFGSEDQKPDRKGGEKKLSSARAVMKQTLEALSDVCAADLSNEEALEFDATIAEFLKEAGNRRRAFRVTKGIAA